MKTLNYFFGLIPFCVFFPLAAAGANESLSKAQPDYLWVTSISGSAIWSEPGQSQTLSLAPGIEKTYTRPYNHETLIGGELFVGIQQSLFPSLYHHVGIAIATTSPASLSGDVLDDASPDFNNYTYHYRLSHSHIAIKEKLLWDSGHKILPWVSLSVGAAWNEASDYTNTPKLEEAVASPNFSDHTTFTFSYTLGVGMQYEMNQHWQLGMGYEFSDWGRSHLGAAPGQSLGQGLGLSHFYTHALVLNFTYIQND